MPASLHLNLRPSRDQAEVQGRDCPLGQVARKRRMAEPPTPFLGLVYLYQEEILMIS